MLRVKERVRPSELGLGCMERVADVWFVSGGVSVGKVLRFLEHDPPSTVMSVLHLSPAG